MNWPLDTPLARHRQLAPNASVRVSPLCLGAMNFGEAHKAAMGECTKETAFEILDYFYSQGGNFIDTSNSYQDGESEEWLGEWMKARGNRDEIVLATKYTSSCRPGEKGKIQSNFGGNGAKSMKLSLEASISRIQTTYIDVFYVHWWDYTVSIPELMHSLNDLVVSGKVLYLGISDTPAWVVAKANQYARSNGLRQFALYQGWWNAARRDLERDIIPMCKDEGMGLAPYSVLNSGRFQTAAQFEAREKDNPGRNFVPVTPHDKHVSAALEKIANAKDADLFHIALAYVMQKAPYVFPIVGARKLEHIKGNIAGLGVSLTGEEIKEIESAYEFDPGFPHTFLSGSLLFGGPAVGAFIPKDIPFTKHLGNFDWVEPAHPITPGST